MDSTAIIDVITKTINTLFSNLFSSIDNNVYSALDEMVFINRDILYDNYTDKFIGMSPKSGIIFIANTLLLGFTIFYAIRYLFSVYSENQVEKPYQFIFKLLIISICINSSFFICEQVLEINFLISGSIRAIGEKILNTQINFEQLILKINQFFYIDSSLNVFSFDGIIKSFTSFGLFSLLFSYALRYIMVKLFVLITPLSMIFLLNSTTSWIFKSWIKSVLSLLVIQSIISLILLIIFSMISMDNNIFSKLIYIGAIYALIKANAYTGQIFGGIVTEVSTNIASLKYLGK
ncbi:MAG: hypothetical protein J6J36_09335 [Clostridia bacterium]|nr:hypothetical protein [Clostridia bacterium]